ncbi:MAG TPA: bifunctional molybdopterin-guanine dinucleotide biosynthesis adaptor protein MobB/molybdopterin molybdotransferase MoeA [Rhodobacteraceae bacterium]|nr:bifunctional molybdopterin-guanine dinucleotide biosynthesis adaptor protein MobB/molybdopterin molybdotransferase MoeA [Paracoccaceae bacterium]
MKIFGVIGWKNAGKTGLMERLVREISRRGFGVSTVKHAHHSFDVDQPGKDSYRHRAAGAREVLLSSRRRWALMHENSGANEPPLAELLAKIEPVDLVLVEGFKRDGHAKIEAFRAETKNPLIAPDDPTVCAVASDVALEALSVPLFDLNDTAAIADFVLKKSGLIEKQSEVPELSAPPLRDDCFALPDGVDWIPVDDALSMLRDRLGPVGEAAEIPVAQSLGRVLGEDVRAPRANPPAANSAVDGYGFAHAAIGTGPQALPLVEGRAAAGAPHADEIPRGKAIRVLTGAVLPPGVDTIVMQEDVNVENGHVVFDGSIKPGANARKAGEDVREGDVVLEKGTRLGAPELALLSAVGCAQVSVRRQLRVGVLSTGDEIVEPGTDPSASKTYDANRPMLLGLASAWGYDPVDLGHVSDSRGALRNALDEAARETDVILTSGGASAGDEDHVSALLDETGSLSLWRVALKPGRPLALGTWNSVPLFGLPGNPVAAFVCSLIFARPALGLMAGEGWREPQAFQVPAAFEKRKRPGRREYLRARINDLGQAEVFRSEGSGRISGLSWATGLVELGDEGRNIQIGDPVRFLPFGSFGL